MSSTKADLIKRAAKAAAHHRTDKTDYKEISTPSISFMVGDTKEILESIKGNNRSKAIRLALHIANEAGGLDDLK